MSSRPHDLQVFVGRMMLNALERIAHPEKVLNRHVYDNGDSTCLRAGFPGPAPPPPPPRVAAALRHLVRGPRSTARRLGRARGFLLRLIRGEGGRRLRQRMRCESLGLRLARGKHSVIATLA